jgi:hypothetical protein
LLRTISNVTLAAAPLVVAAAAAAEAMAASPSESDSEAWYAYHVSRCVSQPDVASVTAAVLRQAIDQDEALMSALERSPTLMVVAVAA